MIICKTPYRISFFGGGSDYPAYLEKNEGSVLAATINKYCYISLRELPPFFDKKHRIVWSRIEKTDSLDEIVHPSARECLRFMDIQEGVSMTHDGDLPARSGVGSSSAFTVGLLNALNAYKGKTTDKKRLAQDAIYVEQQMIREAVGCQDQVETAFGGLNRIYFNKDGFRVSPVCIKKDNKTELNESILLFFTGISRTASEIAQEQINATPRKLNEIERLAKMAGEGEELLFQKDGVKQFGRLLDEAWKLKRSITSRISTPQVDEVYNIAMENGAYGGKLLGAGGGGFMLFLAGESARERVKSALKKLVCVPVELEDMGSHITHYTAR